MSKAMEDMRNEVAQEVTQKVTQRVTQEVTQKVAQEVTQKVAQETEEQTKTKSVLRWIAKGLSFEDIAEGEDLTVEQVRTIANMKNE